MRCNVEVRRVHTAIVDEERHFTKVLDDLKTTGSIVYHAVHEYAESRRRVNSHVLGWIQRTFSLTGFTGDTTPGVRKGTKDTSATMTAVHPIGDLDTENFDDGDTGDLSDDDELVRDVTRIVDYVSV
jgi:hypothetical protein